MKQMIQAMTLAAFMFAAGQSYAAAQAATPAARRRRQRKSRLLVKEPAFKQLAHAA